MRVFMKEKATLKQRGRVIAAVEEAGYSPHVVHEEGRVTICVPDADVADFGAQMEALPGVECVKEFTRSYKLVSREFKRADTIVTVDGYRIGAREVVIIAGPCAVESREQVFEAAGQLRKTGAHMLRGGAFKPRSSPYSFRGLKEEGLKILAEAREKFGMPIVTEVMAPGDVELVSSYADVLQIGARNMQNFSLLDALGKAEKPVLLKRGMMSTIEELLMSAEYIVSGGNPNVILCERGIRTFEKQTRNTLDVTAVAVLEDISHLPVIVDPSHATGKSEYVIAAARAGIAAGADGLLVEVHPHPEEALVDGRQSITPETFAQMVAQVKRIARAIDRDLHGVS